MTTPLPIGCTLAADELPARLEEIRAVSRDALRAKHRDGTHAVLRFAPARGARERLAAIAAAEARCCAFMTMTLADEREAIALTIDVPADGVAVLEQLLAAFELPAGSAGTIPA